MGDYKQNLVALKKTLNKTKSLSLIIGSVIGSGLMILPGLVYREVGVESFFSWVGMGLFFIPFLYIFVKLIIKWPTAGGIVNIIQELLGIRIGFSVSYLALFAIIILVPVVAIIGANYIGYLFSFSNQMSILIAAVMLVIITYINIYNTDLTLKIQGLSATLLLIFLFLIIALSTNIAWPKFTAQISTTNFWAGKTYYSIAKGMIIVFWAFLGLENLSFTSEEFLNIKKDLPVAVFISFLIMIALYLGLSISVIGVLTQENLTAQVPLAAVITKIFDLKYGKMVAGIGTLIMIINLNAWVWGPSRLLYDLGRKQIVPRAFGKISKYSTPKISLITLLLFYLLILGFMLINKAFVVSVLIKIVNATFMVLYLLTIICFLKISANMKELVIGISALITTIAVMYFYGFYILLPIAVLGLGMLKSVIERVFFRKQETESYM